MPNDKLLTTASVGVATDAISQNGTSTLTLSIEEGKTSVNIDGAIGFFLGTSAALLAALMIVLWLKK